MSFRDLEKSIEKMLKDNPWLLDTCHCPPPRGYDGIYLDIDEKTGEYKYPQKKGDKEKRKPGNRYDYGSDSAF